MLYRMNAGIVSSFKRQGDIVQKRTGQSNREGHPTRITQKPKKNVTTSSEPETYRKKTTTAGNKENEKDIDEHIDNLRRNLSAENVTPNHPSASQVFGLTPLEPVVADTTGPVTPKNVMEKTYMPLLPRLPLAYSIGSADPSICGSACNINVSKSNCYQPFENFAQPRYDNAMLCGNRFTEQRQYEASSATCITMSRSPATTVDFQDQYMDLREGPENTRQSMLKDIPQYNNNSTHTMQNDEIRILREKIDKLVTKEEYNKTLLEVTEKLLTKDDLQMINKKLDKLLRKRINVIPTKPTSFPLSSVEEVIAFKNINDEEYEAAVDYLAFLGERNVHEAVIFCMKESISDVTIGHYSAWGERGNRPLFDTKIIKAIYDAIAVNFQPPPNRDYFFKEVSEGVRFGKQRTRNVVVREAAVRNPGIRARNRQAADVNLNDDRREREEELQESESDN
ncbi:uncharacterized protein LOC118647798 [Monomorium pharaonis]|uniref:uncharacterized protein LOC118647798 n=1 Tax=Monomorium pharaonis TaxID=307658 RepID=UPI0017476145|nr:uncharacterized protein LOC118647798 [Monomorium pharaonis]